MSKSTSADRRDAAAKAANQEMREDRQAAKADVAALNAFLDLWATATQNQKIAFIKDLTQISKRTIKAAVL